jgi:hypothetical protein
VFRRFKIFKIGIGQRRAPPEVLNLFLHGNEVKLHSVFQFADCGKLTQAFLQVVPSLTFRRHTHPAIELDIVGLA